MSGDTKHFWVDIINGELFCWDCIHFILQRETHIPWHVRYMLLSRYQVTINIFRLTSSNDVVDVCRRTSVLRESWNTVTRLLLSTATLRHKKLQGLDRKQLRYLHLQKRSDCKVINKENTNTTK